MIVFTGDEVIEWNGHCLQGKSAQDVSNIIAESRDEAQVELIVSRHLAGNTSNIMMTDMTTSTMSSMPRRISVQSQWRQTHEPMPIPQQPHHRGKLILICNSIAFA